MILTKKLQLKINQMTIEELLQKIRFAPPGDPLFTGNSGTYVMNRVLELRTKNHDAFIAASKQVGWC